MEPRTTPDFTIGGLGQVYHASRIGYKMTAPTQVATMPEDYMAPPRPSRHRSRRLRKKLSIGEFQVLGFDLDFRVDTALSHQAAEALFDRFINEAVEANGLVCGGGGDLYAMHFYVLGCPGHRYRSATATQQEQVSQWLADRRPDGVIDFQVGSLKDANYSESSEALP